MMRHRPWPTALLASLVLIGLGGQMAGQAQPPLDRRVMVSAGAGIKPLVRGFDGQTGAALPAPLRQFLAFSRGFRGGVRVASCDLNGDGIDEVVAGAGSGGRARVRVFNGMDGAQILAFRAFSSKFTRAVYVACQGDFNNDQVPDIVVGAGAEGRSQVRVFDGTNAQRLAAPIGAFEAFPSRYRGGVRVASCDFNNDGVSDVVAGAGAGNRPLVRVYSGADGSRLRSFRAFGKRYDGGVYVACGGDLSGDALPEIIASQGLNAPARVRVFDGASGQLHRQFLPYGKNFEGGVRVATCDLDQDGVADILTGAGAGGRSRARVFNGNTFLPFPAPLGRFNAFGSGFRFPIHVACAPSRISLGPRITAGGTLSYTEGDPATAIDPALTVTDPNSPNLTGATIQITGNYQNGEDVLSFINIPPITGLFTPATGTLTLTGTDSVANYQSALRSVQYQNLSVAPNTANRTVSWDATDGTNLSNTATSTITVTAVNSAPLLTAGGTLNYTENGPAAAIDTTVTVSDVDSVNLASATVQITGNYQSGADILAFVDTVAITGNFVAATGILTLTGTDTLLNYQLALRSVTYLNNSDDPNTADRTVTWVGSDGTALSAPVTSTITVTAVNDGPTLTAGGTLAYTENAPATAIDPALTATDPDSINLTAASIQITGNYQNGEDVLSFTNTPFITGIFTPATGTLDLTGTDTVANYQLALRAVRYHNTSDTPNTGDRTVSWNATDGITPSSTATSTITVAAVNDLPVLTAGATLNYTEGDPATAIDNTVTVNDADSTTLTGATVQITGNYQSGADLLAFIDTVAITGNFVAATGILTLSGTDTLANYQSALRTVMYLNNSNNPSTVDRTVTWIGNDGTDASLPVTSTVTVTAVNDGPTITAGGTLNYAEGDPATAIDPLLTVTDPDSLNLSGATVQITANYQNGEDVLSFTNTGTITGTFTPATGTLDLTGTDTVANYETALRAVRYQNTSGGPNPAPRTVSWNATDGITPGNTATSTITVSVINDPPQPSGGPFTIAENSANGSAVGTVAANDPDVGQTHTFVITGGNTGNAFAINAGTGAITVNNSAALDFETTPSFSLAVQVTDNGTPALSGTTTVTVNLTDANDPPVVTPATFSLPENSANATGVGTVTATDADAPPQTLSFAITGGNTGGAFAINASTGQITVASTAALDFETTPSFSLTVQATDNGVPPLSGSATVTVNLTDVNEAPVPSGGPFSLPENSANGTSVGTVSAGDPDAGQTHSFTITGGNTNGAFAINATTGAITVATSSALDFETTPSFTLTVQVTDNGSPISSGTASVTINLTDVNEAPVINDQAFSLNENSANGTVVGTVPVSDPDTGQTHTFAITAGNTGGAFAISNSGQITVAAVAAVNFEVNPTFTLTVQVTDSGTPGLSDTATVTVNLLNVNEAPVAQDQTYAAQANMQVGIAAGAGLLNGATDEDAGTVLTVNTVSATTPAGGTITFTAATGAFTFDPPPGVTTIAPAGVTFIYEICDNGLPTLCDTATVTIPVSGPVIWFVNAAAVGTNDGRLSNPFTSLGSVPGVDNANDRVFVFTGTYTDGLALLSGEQLIGQGVTGISFDNFFGITPPAGTIARPAINGTRPTLQNTVTLETNGMVRGLDITTTNNTALTDPAGATTGVTVNEADVSATTATAVRFDNLTGTVTLGSTTSTGGTNNVSLTSVAATVNLGSGALSGAAGTAFNVSGSNATISYAGTVSKSSAGRLVDIQSRTGGSVTLSGNLSSTGTSTGINVSNNTGGTHAFSGTSKTLSTGANAAVTLATNTGATINFSGGGLVITTTSGAGFTATGGAAAINVTGSGNTITSTTGTALNVANTTIGASGLTFQSISANGAANGIVLDNTGALGGLTVTGTGAAGTGGTIQNTSAAGAVLNNTVNVSLGFMNINNSGTDSIRITNINGFTLNDSNISDAAGTAPADKAIDIGDFVTGTPVNGNINITNSVLGPAAGNSPHDTLAVGISSGTSTWNINGTTFRNTGNSGISWESRGSSVVTLADVTGCTFAGAGFATSARGIFVNNLDDSVITLFDIHNNSFTNNNIHIDMNQQNDTDPVGSHTFKIRNNTTMTGARSQAMNVFAAAGAFGGIFTGTISGNTIGNSGVVDSGSAIGNGIRVNINGGSDATMLLDGNTIRQTPNGRGIEIIGRNGTGGLDITVTNNDVNPQATAFPLAAILVQSNCLTTCNTVRSDVRGNTVPNPSDVTDLLNTYIQLVESSTSTLELVDTAPASPNCSQQLTTTNTGSASANAGCALIAGPINTPP